MRADLHIHTHHSPDCSVPPREVVRLAAAAGLDIIAVTDHNSPRGGVEAARLARELDLPIRVICGIEVSAREGHVLALGVSDALPRDHTVAETVEFIHAAGGIAIAAHPFRVWSGVGREVCRTVRLDALEVQNGRTSLSGNRAARRLAAELQRPGTGGSDGHFPVELGRAFTTFDGDGSEDDLLEWIVQGRCRAEGRSRRTGETIRYAAKAVTEWLGRGLRRM